jgi:hypothetical protein
MLGLVACGVLAIAFMMFADLSYRANGPILGIVCLPFAVVGLGCPYGIYALVIGVARVQWRPWHGGPSVVTGLGLVAAQGYVGHSGLEGPGSTGAVIYAVLAFAQLFVILPLGLCLGLMLQFAVRAVSRLSAGVGRRP